MKGQMLFDNAWIDGFNAYARIFNPETRKSEKVKIDSRVEYFTPLSNGPYKCVIDTGLRYAKNLGTFKAARDQVGVTSPIYRYIRENHWELDKSSYNLNPRIWYLDIETRALGEFPDPKQAPQEVVLIQVYDNYSETCVVFGLRDLIPLDFNFKFRYIQCQNETELFEKFFAVFKACDPSVIYAWNGSGFDFPYLYNRIKRIGLDVNNLSNHGSVSLRTFGNDAIGEKSDLIAPGHYWLDMIDLYKKVVLKPRSSYALDAIAEVELGDNKIPHTEFQDFDSFYTGARYSPADTPYADELREKIRQAYLNETSDFIPLVHQMFVKYGAQDVVLLKRLDAKLKLTPLLTMQASMMGVLLSDPLSTTKPWGIYISHIAMKGKLVLPAVKENQDASFKGGFVRDPIPGKHKWVMNCDANSMYPMLVMVGFNISPETYVPVEKLPPDLREIVETYFNDEDEDARLKLPKEVWDKVKAILKRENYSMAINGAVFDCSREGLLPRLIKQIYETRKATQKEMREVERFLVALDEAKRGNRDIDVDYTCDPKELEGISEESWKKLHLRFDDFFIQLYIKQLTLKIMINALYGAQGNKHFIFFNNAIAAAITGSGRFFIKKLADYINQTISDIAGEGHHVIYGDTDSVLDGAVRVASSNGQSDVLIKDLFDSVGGTIFERESGNLVKLLSDPLYVETSKGPSKVSYIKKHKTPKRLYRLTVGNKNVTITEDHSLMVHRNGELVAASISELQPGDMLEIQ